VPCAKQIDTLAAEWPAKTNYLYLTYGGTQDDIQYQARTVSSSWEAMLSHRSSVEFDWCCVNMASRYEKRAGSDHDQLQPETVSTDFDILDKLYFEELTFERVLDIMRRNSLTVVVVSVGGRFRTVWRKGWRLTQAFSVARRTA